MTSLIQVSYDLEIVVGDKQKDFESIYSILDLFLARIQTTERKGTYGYKIIYPSKDPFYKTYIKYLHKGFKESITKRRLIGNKTHLISIYSDLDSYIKSIKKEYKWNPPHPEGYKWNLSHPLEDDTFIRFLVRILTTVVELAPYMSSITYPTFEYYLTLCPYLFETLKIVEKINYDILKDLKIVIIKK